MPNRIFIDTSFVIALINENEVTIVGCIAKLSLEERKCTLKNP